jgi:hypothetical protein
MAPFSTRTGQISARSSATRNPAISSSPTSSHRLPTAQEFVKHFR